MSNAPSATEMQQRLDRLAKSLENRRIDIVLLSSRVSLYYFTGSTQEGQWLFRPGKTPIWVIRRNKKRALDDLAAYGETKDKLTMIEPLKRFDDLTRYAESLLDGQKPTRIGLEMDQITAETFRRIALLFPGAEPINVSPMLRELRSVKSEWEIQQSRYAAGILHAAAVEGFRLLDAGQRESELAAYITRVIIQRGAQAVVRVHRAGNELPHVLVSSGPNGAAASYFPGVSTGQGQTAAVPIGPSQRRMLTGEPILCDTAIGYNGYVADQTRLYWLGKLPARLAEAYAVACEIQWDIVTSARPGMNAGELYHRAETLAEKAGLIDHFMGYQRTRLPFIGHGIGLELDELPVLARGDKTPLVPGMVVAIEPKFVFPGLGCVGNEDSYAMTEHGFVPITHAPKRIAT